MNTLQYSNAKLHTLETITSIINRLKYQGKKVVFTNGCFDILHAGHLQSLNQAASFGDYLVVGINTDASVKRLKGEERPINDEQSRAVVLANLMMVDAVILFEEDTPLHLITSILPNILVKGGDYTLEQIVGAKEVIANGGTVEIIPTLQGFSSTGIIEKMKSGESPRL
jgi:D-glycero-beta-D-manno-heptose 1-phosphate adenylyltransferase